MNMHVMRVSLLIHFTIFYLFSSFIFLLNSSGDCSLGHFFPSTHFLSVSALGAVCPFCKSLLRGSYLSLQRLRYLYILLQMSYSEQSFEITVWLIGHLPSNE